MRAAFYSNNTKHLNTSNTYKKHQSTFTSFPARIAALSMKMKPQRQQQHNQSSSSCCTSGESSSIISQKTPPPDTGRRGYSSTSNLVYCVVLHCTPVLGPARQASRASQSLLVVLARGEAFDLAAYKGQCCTVSLEQQMTSAPPIFPVSK